MCSYTVDGQNVLKSTLFKLKQDFGAKCLECCRTFNKEQRTNAVETFYFHTDVSRVNFFFVKAKYGFFKKTKLKT